MGLLIVPGIFGIYQLSDYCVLCLLPRQPCSYRVSTVIVRAGGLIWVSPVATVLFNVCSTVTVECCVLYLCCLGVFGMFAVMKGRRLFSSVFAITERRDMGLYEVSLSVSLLGFGIGTMLANFHV